MRNTARVKISTTYGW